MKVITLFTLNTPYRQELSVKAWHFGHSEKKSLAVVGALRGNELQQMYSCSQLIQALRRLEADGALSPDCGVLVVPCANQFSMNVGRRFWAADNTDINRMFPGYIEGETTQRIAARIFEALKGYKYGVQMASFYLPGDFLPHVRMMETGYENIDDAYDFGLPYVILRKPQPYDTTTLNYNWQIWETQAFSLYTRETDCIDINSAKVAVNSVFRFMHRKGFSFKKEPSSASKSLFFRESELHTVLSKAGGLFLRVHAPGDFVREGETLADILDACTGEIIEELKSDCSGHVFFAHKAQLIAGHEVAFRIMPDRRRCRTSSNVL